MKRSSLPQSFCWRSRLHLIARRRKASNTHFQVSKGTVARVKFGAEHKNTMSDFQKQEEYQTLDWTSQDFLSEISDQHVANTFPSSSDALPSSRDPAYAKHWLKPFLRFTDGEMQFFKMASYPLMERLDSLNADSSTQPSDGRRRVVSGIDEKTEWSAHTFNRAHSETLYGGNPEAVSRELEYLRVWRESVSRETMEDDLEVRLPNGQVIPYKQYLDSMKATGEVQDDDDGSGKVRKSRFKTVPLDPDTALEIGKVRNSVKEATKKRSLLLSENQKRGGSAQGEDDDDSFGGAEVDEENQALMLGSKKQRCSNDLIREVFEDLDLNPDKKEHLTLEQLAQVENGYFVKPRLDSLGRAYATGKRKTAFAEVWLFPGDGQIFVNGQHYAYFFEDYTDRLNVALPLLICDVQRQVNVVATVQKGGKSGKSGAVRVAIAKALAKYEPNFMPFLDAYKLLATDYRKHERKKPGKRRARKSEQWKKR